MKRPFARRASLILVPALSMGCTVQPGAATDGTQNQGISQTPSDDSAVGPKQGATDPQGPTADGGTAAQPAAPAEAADVPVGATWLAHVNVFRRASKLPELTEDAPLSDAALAHAKYIVRADKVTHDEDKKSPHYSDKGNESGLNSDVLGTDRPGTYDTSIEAFAKAPFHALQFLNPSLAKTGYGEFLETGSGFIYAAVLDVRHGMVKAPVPSGTYPILFPGDGSTISINKAITEYPDPLASCAGYSYPAGLPIVVQLDPTKAATGIKSHALTLDGVAVDHCVFDAKSYTNAKDPTGQALGRVLLAGSNAVVLIPKAPLTPKATYAVSIAIGGETVKWSFRVANNAR